MSVTNSISLTRMNTLPIEVVKHVISYCKPDVQFSEIDMRYPKYIIYGYIMDICESSGDNIRNLLKILSLYLSKVEPMFAIHPPFQFMRLPEINCYRYWNMNYENTTRCHNIYKDIIILLDKVYNRIYSTQQNECIFCRSSIYYYMRGLIIDIVKQHWALRKKLRSYTI